MNLNIKKYILILLCGVVSLGAMAETKTRNAHAKAHQQQLAAAKTHGLDKSTISKMMEEEILGREVANTLSKESEEMLNDLLAEARTHLGKRYSRGSKGPKTFDCSGFSSYVYKQFGYTLSPSSRAQFLQGEKVDRKSLRKGDLVFFTSRNSGKGVGHVGIVVDAAEDGNFSFIHAATNGITISDCKGYYAGRYLGARRIIE